MKRWKIKFKEELFDELNNYLFATAPEENGCFLLGHTRDTVMFITDIIYPESEAWIQRGEELCVPIPKYIIHASVIAQNSDSSLLFVHTHPGEDHPSSFSWIDHISNGKLFDNLSEVISHPLGSIVMSRKGIHGVIFNEGEEEIIEKYSIYGNRINFITDFEKPQEKLDSSEFHRQLLFMKDSGDVLSNLNIAIIGLGGIGSPLAVQLAKIGVMNMTFFDHDKVERHNLPRILGANHSSINKFKVEVVRDFIQTFSCAKIETVTDRLHSDTELADFDVVFGCVDNHITRDMMNELSLRYCIPYIDSACAIPVSESGEVLQAAIAVSVFFLGKPCLWCNGTLNAMAIMEENLTEEELEQRVKDGYTQDIQKAPSVITLTSAVASFGINRLLNLINILPGEFPDKMMFDFNNSMYFEPDVKRDEKCSCNQQNVFKSRMSHALGVN